MIVIPVDILPTSESGELHPEKLITRTISLDEAPEELMQMDTFKHPGVTIIDPLTS